MVDLRLFSDITCTFERYQFFKSYSRIIQIWYRLYRCLWNIVNGYNARKILKINFILHMRNPSMTLNHRKRDLFLKTESIYYHSIFRHTQQKMTFWKWLKFVGVSHVETFSAIYVIKRSKTIFQRQLFRKTWTFKTFME